MRKLLIAAFLVAGCGGGGTPAMMMTGGAAGAGGAPTEPVTTDLTWQIRFAGGSWYCNGLMNTHSVTRAGVVDLAGSWNCSGISAGDATAVTMGGSLTGRYTPGPETVTLSLVNGSMGAIPVTGTIGASGIVGTATFSNASVPFTAQ